jgi:hypothetical protein
MPAPSPSALQSEKNAFCEKIANLSEAERSNPAVVGGMVRTLEAIIGVEASSAASQVDERRLQDTEFRVKEGQRDANATLEGKESRKVSEQKPSESCDDPSPKHQVLQQPNIPTRSTRESIDTNSLWSPIQPTNNESMDEGLQEGNLPSTPAFNDEHLGTGSTNPTTEARQSETEGERTEDGNEPWVKFGMATLGVVVGGVLLSMRGGNENADDSQSREENHQRRDVSTVQIEELSDDVEDEWVSVPDQ